MNGLDSESGKFKVQQKRRLDKEQKILERCKLAVAEIHFEQTRKQEKENLQKELRNIATSLVRDKMNNNNNKKVSFADNDNFEESNNDIIDIEGQIKELAQGGYNNLGQNIGQDSPDAEQVSKLNCKIAEYNPMFYRNANFIMKLVNNFNMRRFEFSTRFFRTSSKNDGQALTFQGHTPNERKKRIKLKEKKTNNKVSS